MLYINGHTLKTEIGNILDERDDAVRKAVKILYNYQTVSERNSYVCREVNGVGFNKYDVKYLTHIAHEIYRGKILSNKQITESREKLKKYWRQLLDILLIKYTKTYTDKVVYIPRRNIAIVYSQGEFQFMRGLQ